MRCTFVLFSFVASVLLFQGTFAQEIEERAENVQDLLIGKVEVYVEEAIPQLGQNTRLICITKFKKRPSGDISSVWIKSAYDEDVNKTAYSSIALGTRLINEYYSKRYHLDMQQKTDEDNTYTRNYTLTIANASVADSGLFECKHLIGDETFEGNHTILVSKAIGTSWSVTGYDQSINRSMAEEGVLKAKASETYDLECTVRHSSKQHKYNRADVYISGTKESKRTNISRLFERANTSKSSTDEKYIKTAVDDSKSTSDPLIQLYDISLRNKKFKFNYTHNGQYLHCYSANNKSGNGRKDAVIKLNITHRPAYQCNHIQTASLHASNKKIKCRVYANPIKFEKIYWEFSYGGRNTRLSPGNHKGERDYRITAGIKKMTNEYAEFTLQFAKIKADNFKTYKLFAKNSEGERSLEIKLKEKTGPRGAASQTTAQLSLLSMLFVVARVFSKA